MAELLLRTKLTEEEEKTVDECVNGIFNDLTAFFESPEGKEIIYYIIGRNIEPILAIEDCVNKAVVDEYVGRMFDMKSEEFLTASLKKLQG